MKKLRSVRLGNLSEVTGREGLCHQSNPSPSPVEELGHLKVLKISKVPLGLQKQVGRPELSLPELADSLPPRPTAETDPGPGPTGDSEVSFFQEAFA